MTSNKEWHRIRYHKNLDKERKRSRDKYYKFKDRYTSYAREKYKLVKKFIINYYTDGENRCVCCGENTIEFLTIDHINGGGTTHRKSLKSADIYRWLAKNLFPEGYQILCYNCNCAKQYNHGCPHKLKKSNFVTVAK